MKILAGVSRETLKRPRDKRNTYMPLRKGMCLEGTEFLCNKSVDFNKKNKLKFAERNAHG